MTITLNSDYDVTLSIALLGYVGETNARPVSVEGMEIDGADRYVLTIDYGDGVTYEVDITGGQWTPTADILRSAQTVSCQICAKKLSGQEYILLKKSRIFRLRIGAAIGDTAIPSPDVAMDALDRIDAIGRQAHADMQTAVTAADTATTMANNAAKSATAAEKSADTATQAAERAETAQAVADSLPDDYVTAVGKIAENTAEIGRVKLTDKELQRRVDALYFIGQGVTHKFETDSETAYQKVVPTGGKLMSVKSVGGRSIVWNQMCSTFTYQGTECNCKPVYSAHKYLCRIDCEAEQGTTVYMYFREVIYTKNNQTSKAVNAGKSTLSWITSPYGDSDIGGTFDAFLIGNSVKVTFSNRQIFDLTLIFGSGNEPTTVEEFEKIFPADYYPYSAGEIVSAGTESVVEQGKNLLDFNSAKFSMSYRYISDAIPGGKKAVMSLIDKDTSVDVSGISIGFANDVGELDGGVTEFNWILSSSGLNSNNSNLSSVHGKITLCRDVFIYPKTDEALAKLLSRYDIQVELGDTPTAYSPYHSNTHQIPEAIKALPGYGWSAGRLRTTLIMKINDTFSV